jgi:MoxR-like ATPase
MSQENNLEVTQSRCNQNAKGPEGLRATSQLIAHSRAELGRVISGQGEVIEEVLIAVLCQGHALLEGVPGIAKTLIVKALGRLLGLGFQRVQATPDLMPADILGTTILRPGSVDFAFHAGPVFTDLLLVDEINRMPPRTQAALLECMEERQVTSDGTRRPLPAWFTVFATQNPIDFEGTYPLPEAQLDRFLLKIRVAYPRSRGVADSGAAPRRLGRGAAGRRAIAPIPEGLLAAACAEVRAIRIEPELYRLHSGAGAAHPRVAHAAAGRQPPRRREPDARGPGGGRLRWPRLPAARRREARRAAGAAASRDAQARG